MRSCNRCTLHNWAFGLVLHVHQAHNVKHERQELHVEMNDWRLVVLGDPVVCRILVGYLNEVGFQRRLLFQTSFNSHLKIKTNIYLVIFGFIIEC